MIIIVIIVIVVIIIIITIIIIIIIIIIILITIAIVIVILIINVFITVSLIIIIIAFLFFNNIIISISPLFAALLCLLSLCDLNTIQLEWNISYVNFFQQGTNRRKNLVFLINTILTVCVNQVPHNTSHLVRPLTIASITIELDLAPWHSLRLALLYARLKGSNRWLYTR